MLLGAPGLTTRSKDVMRVFSISEFEVTDPHAKSRRSTDGRSMALLNPMRDLPVHWHRAFAHGRY